MNNYFLATTALWKREIVRFVRQRSRWIGALATPLMFWFLIGGGFQSSFRDSSGAGATNVGYFEFFFPGAITLSVLFTAIFSTISVIEDRHQGFLQGVLVSPIPRGAVVLSKILGGATLGLLQGALLLILSPFVGIHISFWGLLAILGLLFLMASCLTALGFLFAWKIDSVQGYHGIMNMVLMPMWLLSGAVFPLGGANVFFRWVAVINPLTYGVSAMRMLMWQPTSVNTGKYAVASAASSVSQIELTFVILLAASGLLYWMSTRLVAGPRSASV